jgi:16S rRNA (guanine527-N7)-methyltransferase
MELIRKYFPELDQIQIRQYASLLEMVPLLNQRVNIISRKDVEHLEERHVLHSLAIAKQFQFGKNTRILDAGTGGGFPGIPLAILFPEARFTLSDSIGKKIRLVREIIEALGLRNVLAVNDRVENLEIRAEYVVSRAVATFPNLVRWTAGIIGPGGEESGKGGWIALKGGDLDSELKPFAGSVQLFPVSTWFEESFFSTKTIVYLKK